MMNLALIKEKVSAVFKIITELTYCGSGKRLISVLKAPKLKERVPLTYRFADLEIAYFKLIKPPVSKTILPELDDM